MALQNWPRVIMAVQPPLNQAALQLVGKSDANQDRSPVEVVTCMKPRRAVLTLLRLDEKWLKASIMASARAVQKIKIKELQEV